MKRIFLSYCWLDEIYADKIDYYFQQVGIKLIRDKRDLSYSSSIEGFARKIRKTSYAVCIVSEEFLKRENCMYEIVEFQKDDNFSKKICPIVVNYSDSHLKLAPQNIEEYASYWQEKVEQQNRLIDGISNNIHKNEQIKQLRKYSIIYDGIRDFLFFLKDAIYISSDIIDVQGIKSLNQNIFKKIGISPKINLEDLYSITQSNTIEEAEQRLTEYMNNHLIKENDYFLYTKANVYEKFEYYDLALYNYKLAYSISKDFILAYESIIVLYVRGIYKIDSLFGYVVNTLEKIDKSNATLKLAHGLFKLKEMKYEEAIPILKEALERATPKTKCYIYNNLANAYEELASESNDYLKTSERYYLLAIKENENYYQAINNLALLYLAKFRCVDLAAVTLQKCLSVAPKYYMGLNTLGLIQEINMIVYVRQSSK